MEFAALMLQPSGPKAGTPAAEAPAQPAPASQGTPPAAGGQPPPPQMGIFGSPLFFILLFLPFIFIMWRRNKRETDARSKLKKGDKVIAGGLVGEVMDIDDRIAKVKIAPGVTVQVLASALGPFETGAPAKDKDTKDKDKDTKDKDKSPKNALESK
ncbi:MAG TPA: preprotein translocase subunit YajC [Polyangiaceae bacterium]|nr:preprotein translocase subunit YajC [Polyangiaceae bacterium]